MKKCCLILAVCLVLASNAKAASFVDTLGAECGRILYSLNMNDYPARYSVIAERNTQFDALEKCLGIYKQMGGDMQELNARYSRAIAVSNCWHIDCKARKKETSEKTSDTCTGTTFINFGIVMEQDICTTYYNFKDILTNCPIISVLKPLCEKLSAVENSVDK